MHELKHELKFTVLDSGHILLLKTKKKSCNLKFLEYSICNKCPNGVQHLVVSMFITYAEAGKTFQTPYSIKFVGMHDTCSRYMFNTWNILCDLQSNSFQYLFLLNF